MPQFLIVAKNRAGSEQELAAAKPAHMIGVRALVSKGQLYCAGPLFGDGGKKIGLSFIVDMPDRAAVDLYVTQEPYNKSGCWESVEVTAMELVIRDGKLPPRLM